MKGVGFLRSNYLLTFGDWKPRVVEKKYRRCPKHGGCLWVGDDKHFVIEITVYIRL